MNNKIFMLITFTLLLMAPFSLTESTITLENRHLKAKISDNELGLIGITVTTPIIVEQDSAINHATMIVRNNQQNCFMIIENISPNHSSNPGFESTIQTYDSGPYSPGEQSIIYFIITGKHPGTYTIYYEVEASFLSDQGSVASLTRVYQLQVDIIVNAKQLITP